MIYGARRPARAETAGAFERVPRRRRGGRGAGVGGEAAPRRAGRPRSGSEPRFVAPSHRKSDLRHARGAFAARSSRRGRGFERAPRRRARRGRRQFPSAARTSSGGSDKEKAAAAACPLGALHAAEALCGGGSGGEGLHAFLDTTPPALREGKHRAPAGALRAVIEGIAPPLERGGPAPSRRLPRGDRREAPRRDGRLPRR